MCVEGQRTAYIGLWSAVASKRAWVCRYDRMLVAEADMDSRGPAASTSTSGVAPLDPP